MGDQLEIPEKFTSQFGEHIIYKKGGKKVCEGIIVDAAFSSSTIMNMKSGLEYYGIKLKIKPTDGFNNNRAIWTMPFKSGIIKN